MTAKTDKTDYFTLPKRKRTAYASQAGIRRPHTVAAAPSEEKLPVGAPLITALWDKMSKDGITPVQLATKLSVSHSYLMQLYHGDRPTPNLPGPLMRQMAAYLDLPPAQVYVLSGALTAEDFHYHGTLDARLDRAHERMLTDPVWAGYTPTRAEWRSCSKKVKIFMTLLFERAAHSPVLDKTLTSGASDAKHEPSRRSKAA